MKKAISLFITLACCMSIMLGVTSCNAKHPIEEFKSKMDAAGNYQISITMSEVPFFGTITTVTKVDGNIQYSLAAMFDTEEYTETVGNTVYKYTKNENGVWSKALDTDENDNTAGADSKTLETLFNPANYEKVDEKTYKQKSDVSFDDFRDVVMTLEGDLCTIEMVSLEEGYGVKFVISEVGKIELTLPPVE